MAGGIRFLREDCCYLSLMYLPPDCVNGINTLSLPEVIVIVPSRIFPVVFSETSYLIVELPAFPDFDLDDSVIQSESDSAVHVVSLVWLNVLS